MQLERRVLGNATALGFSAIIGQIANFGFVILVARGFGREVFAQYSISMAIAGLVCLLVTFGSISLLTRSAARDPSRSIEMLASVLPVQVMIGIIIWIATISLGLALSISIDNLIILACIVAHHILTRITGVLLTQLHGREHLDIVALVKVGRYIGTLALGVALALTTGSAIAGVSAMPIASGIFLLFGYLKVRSVVGSLPMKWDPRGAFEVTRKAFPFFLIVAVTAACDRLGPLMLTVIQDADSLATYATGERIITFAATFYSILTAASLPAASRLAQVEDAQLQELVNRVARIIVLTMLPAATLLFLFSVDIVVLLFGTEFATSAVVLQTIAWVLVIRGYNSLQSMVAVTKGLQRDVLRSRCFSLCLLAVTGPPLIWAVGPVGLAVAVLVLEVGHSIVLHRTLARVEITISPFHSYGTVFLACAVTVAVGLLLADIDLAYRLLLLPSCIVAGLWVFRAIRKHDLRYLSAILLTRRSDPSEGI